MNIIERVRNTPAVPVAQGDFDDALKVVRSSGLRELVEEWREDDKSRRGNPGPGGRPARLNIEHVLVGMMILLFEGRPMYEVLIADLLCKRLNLQQRAALGVPVQGDEKTECWTDWVHRAFASFGKLVDPTPDASRRKSVPFEKYKELKEEADADPYTAVKAERLDLASNMLVYSAARLLPERYRPERYTIAYDATMIPIRRNTIPGRKVFDPEDPPTEEQKLFIEPEANWYYRETESHGPHPTVKKAFVGFEGDIALGMDYDAQKQAASPMLALGVRHHVPGDAPDDHLIASLKRLDSFGVPVREVVADRAYNGRGAADGAGAYMYLRGIERAIDYRKNEIGVQAQYDNYIMLNGLWYCNSVPKPLRTLGKRATELYYLNRGRKVRGEARDRQSFDQEFAMLSIKEARPKQAVTANGGLVVQCPAQGVNKRAACELRPESMTVAAGGRKSLPMIFPSAANDAEHLMKACSSKSSLTIPFDASGYRPMRHWQTHPYRSEKWYERYNRRTHVEGFNAFLKDPQALNIGDWRHFLKRGKVARAIAFAAAVAVANVMRIRGFLAEQEYRAEVGGIVAARGRKASRAAQIDDLMNGRTRHATKHTGSRMSTRPKKPDPALRR